MKKKSVTLGSIMEKLQIIQERQKGFEKRQEGFEKRQEGFERAMIDLAYAIEGLKKISMRQHDRLCNIMVRIDSIKHFLKTNVATKNDLSAYVGKVGI